MKKTSIFYQFFKFSFAIVIVNKSMIIYEKKFWLGKVRANHSKIIIFVFNCKIFIVFYHF